jgi:copper homeostasis protein
MLELCVDSAASALAAQRGGASRIELCSNLRDGGTTPHAQLIATTRTKFVGAVHVMIRPRPGDFCYSDNEFEIMQRDVLLAKELGANGVVFGILQESGVIDRERTKCLVELARPLSTTFHRAFDLSPDLDHALEATIEAGVNRILTSGGAATAVDGLATIAGLVARAGNRVAIMAGGGIREHNVRRIIAEGRVREIHANLGVPVSIPRPRAHPAATLQAAEQLVVSPDRVRCLLDAALS